MQDTGETAQNRPNPGFYQKKPNLSYGRFLTRPFAVLVQYLIQEQIGLIIRGCVRPTQWPQLNYHAPEGQVQED